MVLVSGALGMCCAFGKSTWIVGSQAISCSSIALCRDACANPYSACACLVQVAFSAVLLLCMQADKANAAASAAVADAANNEEDMDAYSDYDETPAEVSQAGTAKGLSAKSGKRPMEGATPGNQIGAAKRAKRNRP